MVQSFRLEKLETYIEVTQMGHRNLLNIHFRESQIRVSILFLQKCHQGWSANQIDLGKVSFFKEAGDTIYKLKPGGPKTIK